MRNVLGIAVLGSALSFGAGLTGSALADTAARGDVAGVRAMLTQKVDVNAPQVDGTTALHWAAYHDDAATVKALLAAGANAKAVNRYGITPLAQACENGNAEIVEMLVKAGADVNAPHAEGETPLMTAARTGNPAVIQILLDHGASINAAEEWRGQTPLMWAAAEGHVPAVKLLIAKGAKIDAKSKEFDFTALKPKAGSVAMNFPRGGFTPLLFAARQGHMDVVKTLIDAGANINLADPDSTTPLLISIINFHYDIAAYLIERGADVNAADTRGRTPLYAAIDQKNLDISNRPPAKVEDQNTPVSLMKLLIAKGANPNTTLSKQLAPRAVLDGADMALAAGATPFLRAARASDIETMKFLLEHGADMKATTATGINALMLAAGAGWRDGKTRAPDPDSVEAVKWLVSMGFDVNAAANNGETALHGAAGRGADTVVQTLVDLKANVNALDKNGKSPYDTASGGAIPGGVKLPHESTMELLRRLGSGPGPGKPPAPVAPTAP